MVALFGSFILDAFWASLFIEQLKFIRLANEALTINESLTIKVWQVKGASCRNRRKFKMQWCTRGTARSTLVGMFRLRVGLWAGIWWWMKTLGGRSMCKSYDPGFRPSHRQTKADWKQRLAVYHSCWGLSVRNSPLICFILFYGAVTPNSVVREMCEGSCFSESPLLEPRDCSHGIRAAAEAYVYLTSTACIYGGIHA